MLNIKTIAISAAILLFVPIGLFAQESTFSDPNVDYSFVLPESGWKQIMKPSATSPNVEYVYNDRREGHLEVRKLAVAKNAILTDVMRS